MQVANPIYDVIFKYLLDDNKIAKLILSAIIGSKIVELEFRPKEYQTTSDEGRFTVYRLDFAAKIKLKTGAFKLVLIEIQKAKFPTDIMRFRKYLGEQYANPENTLINETSGVREKGLPLISIYFLGHTLEHTDAPVIKVSRKYFDLINNREVVEKEDFIESLTHDSYVVQIPLLSGKRRSELEIILSFFNQEYIDSTDHHFLNIREEDFPKKYQPIVRRLLKAAAEPEIRKKMDVEDDVLLELENLERAVSKKNRLLLEKDKRLEEKDKRLEEKDKRLEEKDKRLEEKDKLIQELKKRLNKNG